MKRQRPVTTLGVFPDDVKKHRTEALKTGLGDV